MTLVTGMSRCECSYPLHGSPWWKISTSVCERRESQEIFLEEVTFRLIPKGQAPSNLFSSEHVNRGLAVLNIYGRENGLSGSYYDHDCSLVNIIIAYD